MTSITLHENLDHVGYYKHNNELLRRMTMNLYLVEATTSEASRQSRDRERTPSNVFQ